MDSLTFAQILSAMVSIPLLIFSALGWVKIFTSGVNESPHELAELERQQVEYSKRFKVPKP